MSEVAASLRLMERMTRAHQRSIVGSGLALGALMIGVDRVNGNATSLQQALHSPWWHWEHAHRYPLFRVGPPHDDVLRVMKETQMRTRGTLTWWAGQWPFVPRARDDWDDAEEIAEFLDPGVPARAWKSLVSDWLLRDDDGPRVNGVTILAQP